LVQAIPGRKGRRRSVCESACVSEPLRDDAPAYIVEIDAVLVVMRASSSSPSAGTGVAGAIGTGEPWK
jgi:hypothetical protein